MSDRFSEQVLKFVARPEYRPVKPKRLARIMGITADEYPEFRQELKTLLDQRRIAVGGGGTVARPTGMAGRVVGVFRANRRGFGFVIPNPPETPAPRGSDEPPDVFIPPGASLNAQTGDTVVCRITRRNKRDGKDACSGEIVEILTRGQTQFVGQLQQIEGRWLVQPEGNRLHEPIHVEDVGAKGARVGDQVVVEIIEYPSPGRHATGVITERLGSRGDPGVDVVSMVRQYDLPDIFSEEALDDARQAARSFDAEAELPHREDLRGELTITIDPVDARDFDDAISLRRLGPEAEPLHSDRTHHREHQKAGHGEAGPSVVRRGRKQKSARPPAAQGPAVWELGVHIADVSHFIREGGVLDVESRQRGTSVYFPRHVIPMLPEIISNGVCSLQEAQPRLCKSAFIRYDANGNVVGARFSNSVIRSAKRLTYEQASAVLEGNVGDVPHPIVVLLQEMERLARTIRQRRLRDGMLVLDLPEIALELDEEGRVVDAHPADSSFSHTLIEMFMVEANEAVARRLTESGQPFLRRVHPSPDPDALENLRRFMRGLDLDLAKNAGHKDLQRLLESVRGTPQAQTVNMAVLRSMAQAVYAPKDEGHFALASKDYCHFTSPIRRYPDLHVHRLLHGLAGPTAGKQGDQKRRKPERPKSTGPLDENSAGAVVDVVELGRHCSFVERRAESAERELRLVKVLELLAKQPGEAFEGVVTGVAAFGIFVRHPRFLIDGMIEVIDLPEDRWELDDSRSALLGLRTGRRFRIGDVIPVAIARVDIATRRLSLALVEAPGATAATRASHATREIRRAPEPKRRGRDSRKGSGGGRPSRRSGRRRR